MRTPNLNVITCSTFVSGGHRVSLRIRLIALASLIAAASCGPNVTPLGPDPKCGTVSSRRSALEVTGFGSNPGGLKMHTYIPADMPAEGICLAQGLKIEDEGQVGGELDAGPGAHRADQLDAAAQQPQDRPGPLNIRRLASDEADQLALPGRADRAAHGALDEGGTTAAHAFGERDLRRGLDRAHLDEEPARHVRGEQA